MDPSFVLFFKCLSSMALWLVDCDDTTGLDILIVVVFLKKRSRFLRSDFICFKSSPFSSRAIKNHRRNQAK